MFYSSFQNNFQSYLNFFNDRELIYLGNTLKQQSCKKFSNNKNLKFNNNKLKF